MSLASRLAVVTGGGSGIGRGVCEVFACEGASVAVVGNIPSENEETVRLLKDIAKKNGHVGSKFIPFEVDVSISSQVIALFSSLESSFGQDLPPSIVVNSAGIGTRDTFAMETESSFDKIINVNLKGTYLVMQAATKMMVERKISSGSIINMSSILAKIGGDCPSYTASKGGISSMTITCAKEFGKHGIRCNALLPGFIESPLNDRIVSQKEREEFVKKVALGRTGQPSEVGELCAFLASEKSSYITGACIEITGGGSGIGRATCEIFAREGASVAVVGNIQSDNEETIRLLKDIAEKNGHVGSKFIPFEVDVSVSSQVDTLISSLESSFGEGLPLSVVVNSAGIGSSQTLMVDTNYERVFDVNLKGTYLVVQAAAKLMVDKKISNGSIINISSIEAKMGGLCPSYGATKGGVSSMTIVCAKELGKHGIRCNAILPGYIETPLSAAVPKSRIDEFMPKIALGRPGKPEEVGELCAFLASDKSSYITGACIEITGGTF